MKKGLVNVKILYIHIFSIIDETASVRKSLRILYMKVKQYSDSFDSTP